MEGTISIKRGTEVPDVYFLFKATIWMGIIRGLFENYFSAVIDRLADFTVNLVRMWINLHLLPTPYIM